MAGGFTNYDLRGTLAEVGDGRGGGEKDKDATFGSNGATSVLLVSRTDYDGGQRDGGALRWAEARRYSSSRRKRKMGTG